MPQPNGFHFQNLTSWQVAQLARHPGRPYTLDYIRYIFTEFDELHGDRHFADDPSIVGGMARLDGRPVMVIGHQRDVRSKRRFAGISVCRSRKVTARPVV